MAEIILIFFATINLVVAIAQIANGQEGMSISEFDLKIWREYSGN